MFTNNMVQEGQKWGSEIVISSSDIVVPDKFPDMRQKIWDSLNVSVTGETYKGVNAFVAKKNLNGIIPVLRFVFSTDDVYPIIIDICDMLLTNYKDRAKAYSDILHKYKF